MNNSFKNLFNKTDTIIAIIIYAMIVFLWNAAENFEAVKGLKPKPGLSENQGIGGGRGGATPYSSLNTIFLCVGRKSYRRAKDGARTHRDPTLPICRHMSTTR